MISSAYTDEIRMSRIFVVSYDGLKEETRATVEGRSRCS